MRHSSSIIYVTGILIFSVLLISSSIFVISQTEQVAIKRFGKITNILHDPGIHFKIPFLDNIIVLDNRLRRYDLPTKTIQVREGAFYSVDAFFVYRITNAKLFLEKIASSLPSNAEKVNLAPRFNDILRIVYGQSSFNDALSSSRSEMIKKVKNRISIDAKLLGITIIDVRIRKTDLTQAISAKTFERMKQERYTVAEKTRAIGREEKDRILSDANQAYENIISNSNREAEIIKGQGDAEGIRILREAISKDPELYKFWRAMRSYEKLKDVPMVLSQDLFFFQYFKFPEKVFQDSSSNKKD